MLWNSFIYWLAECCGLWYNGISHWDQVTYICVSKLTIIGSNNDLPPGRRQAFIWTNAGKLLIQTKGTNSSEILSGIHIFLFKKMHFKMSSGKWGPCCLGLNVLMALFSITRYHIQHKNDMEWQPFRLSYHNRQLLALPCCYQQLILTMTFLC